MKTLICIECPRGCHLTIDENQKVTGNGCPRGIQYALNEVTSPTRMVTTTVKVLSEQWSRLPVKTSHEVPKDKMFEIVQALRKTEVKVPVYVNDVIVSHICGLDVDIIATRMILK